MDMFGFIYQTLALDSSNINEVIRAVSNFLFFFYKKILHAQKASKEPKAPKSTKSIKAQKRNQPKTQNANTRTKKLRLKSALFSTSEWKKVTYSFICVFVSFIFGT